MRGLERDYVGWWSSRCPHPAIRKAEPTIGKAINGGFDFLEAKCNRCNRVSLVPLRALKQTAGNAGLETGSRALLRAVQRWAPLQPPAAGSYLGLSLRPSGSGAVGRTRKAPV